MQRLDLSRTLCHACSALAVFLTFAGSTAQAEEIRISGTGNALGTMQLLGEAFSKKNPQIKVSVLNSIGSSGAIKAVPKGVLDIGLSSRTLTDAERHNGIVALEYAHSPTVLAVSAKSPITGITRQQIADIYNGHLAQWPDGTPTRPILRQPGDDNSKQLQALSPAIEQALQAAEQRQGLSFAVIDQEAADKIENIPGAIGITTLALIKSEGRRLRALKLDGVEATEKNAAAGRYPLSKTFFFITRQTPSPTVQSFIAFVSSPAGHEILAKAGNWVAEVK